MYIHATRATRRPFITFSAGKTNALPKRSSPLPQKNGGAVDVFSLPGKKEYAALFPLPDFFGVKGLFVQIHIYKTPQQPTAASAAPGL